AAGRRAEDGGAPRRVAEESPKCRRRRGKVAEAPPVSPPKEAPSDERQSLWGHASEPPEWSVYRDGASVLRAPPAAGGDAEAAIGLCLVAQIAREESMGDARGTQGEPPERGEATDGRQALAAVDSGAPGAGSARAETSKRGWTAVVRLLARAWYQDQVSARRFRKGLDRRLAEVWSTHEADLADGKAILTAFANERECMSPAQQDEFFFGLLESHGAVTREAATRIRRAFEETIEEMRGAERIGPPGGE
ncbi:MAG: hypothetical protein QME96_02275, partial [Myxococcota bacterium]|nr:hypothetical protein [Myxococcota bacterium]